MLKLCEEFPTNCFPMMGLHPTSVKENYLEEIKKMEDWFEKGKFVAVGEAGIDLYWDKTFFKEQEECFRLQINIAISKNLPLVIHSRESFHDIMEILHDYKGSGLKGVFHCFTGTTEQAKQVIDLGFMLGIGGVVTFKNSKLDQVVENIDLDHLILETDSPFLAPVPFRGKRNESTYINIIANKIAQLKQMSKEEIANRTTENVFRLFNIQNYA